jgi:hypothetical protein
MLPATNPLSQWALKSFGALRFDVSGDAELLPLSFRLDEKALARFTTPGALDARLDEIDAIRPINRVLVMGCGRSGTWLFTGLMSTFKDVCVVAKEVPVELFAQLTSTGQTLILKRHVDAFKRFADIPARIKIAYIIRHPFDVLTSRHPATKGRTYHVSPTRWLGEMTALRLALESGRQHLCVVRYEDLVTDSEGAERKLSDELGLKSKISAQDFTTVFNPSKRATRAMHGVRGIDANSLYKYQSDPAKIEYLASIRPELGETLDWVCRQFNYDTALTQIDDQRASRRAGR